MHSFTFWQTLVLIAFVALMPAMVYLSVWAVGRLVIRVKP